MLVRALVGVRTRSRCGETRMIWRRTAVSSQGSIHQRLVNVSWGLTYGPRPLCGTGQKRQGRSDMLLETGCYQVGSDG